MGLSRDPQVWIYLYLDIYDKVKSMDPGSRPESQRVASCANRLVVTPGAYREDGGKKRPPAPAHGQRANELLVVRIGC